MLRFTNNLNFCKGVAIIIPELFTRVQSQETQAVRNKSLHLRYLNSSSGLLVTTAYDGRDANEQQKLGYRLFYQFVIFGFTYYVARRAGNYI